MGLVYSRTGSGLVVAEHGGDEAAVAHALRQHDPELRLVRQVDLDRGVPRWCVYAYRGPDHPSLFVLAWVSEQGEPLPLSHRLVDRVKEQERGSRAPRQDEDQLNRRARAQREKDWARDTEALEQDYQPSHGRSVLHRGVGLRMARDKRRARGEKI